MQDTGLFLSLAEIAGVFVGFGALIAVRSGGTSEPQEVAPVRIVVAMGMMTIVGALAPVTLGRYDLTDHQVLALSSVLVLVGSFGISLVHIRTPEYKALTGASSPGGSGIVEVVESVAWVLLVGGTALALVVIVLGVLPELEAALYFMVLVLILLLAAWALMSLVFMERRPASRLVAPPTTGAVPQSGMPT